VQHRAHGLLWIGVEKQYLVVIERSFRIGNRQFDQFLFERFEHVSVKTEDSWQVEEDVALVVW
jgi:hypothetical protein